MALPESDNIVNTTRLSSTLNRLWDKTKTKFATKADDSAVVHKTGDTMTGKLTMQKAINQVIKGTGVAATSSTSGSTTTYYPAKWNFDLGEANPTAGDRMVIQIPVAGSDYGEYISTDNGTTYYPVARNQGTARLTTHYPAKAYICVVFEAYESADGCGKVGSIYPVAGGTARVTTTNGCWRVINDYDSGNTYERIYTGGRYYAGSTGINPYSLVALDSDGKYSMFVSGGSGTGTGKTVNTTSKFAYPPNILYYNANNTTAANALVPSNSSYEGFPGADLRYSCNYVAANFSSMKPVFIECTLNDDGTWTPTSNTVDNIANSISQTLRSGHYYVYLGESSSYSLYLQIVNMMYYYDGTQLVSVDSKLLSAKANDEDVVHKASEEVITGRKIFQESVALSQYDSGETGYNVMTLGGLSTTNNQYSDWTEEQKDGHHYREWEIVLPYITLSGDIRVTLTTDTGTLQRTIKVDICTISTTNLFIGLLSSASSGSADPSPNGNRGYYTIADPQLSSDFRISDVLWDSSLSEDYKFVIKIRSMNPVRNLSIASVMLELMGNAIHFEDAYVLSNDPTIVTGETYDVVRYGSPISSAETNIIETVTWLDVPKIQNSLGKDILVDGDIAQSSTNGNLSVLGTDVEVYSHPTQTAYTSKGTATKVPQITTDSTGHVTSISEVTISGVTPSSHASTATTYGIGTTSNYGHVKLATGDMNGATNTDGVAVSKNHTHSQYAPKASPALTGTPTAPTAADGTNTTQIATTAFVQSAVAQGLSVSDAMVYKGTVTLGATSPGGLTVAADKGHTYKVVANGNTKEGYVDGVKVEAGDMVICNTDSTAAATSSNYSTIAAKWDFVQGNTDGVVVGPASATSGNVVVFDGATGKLVKDGGKLGTAAFKDVASSGNASTTQVVMGNDTRLTDVRTPTSHAHGNISNDGAITSTTQSSDITIATGDKLLVTDSSNSNKVVRTGAAFDTTVTNTYLCKNGTFIAVKEADVTWGGSFRTDLSPVEAAGMARNIWHNPLPSAIKYEKTTDGGSTWTEVAVTDTQKQNQFNLTVGWNFGIANADYSGVTDTTLLRARITVYCMSSENVTAYENTWCYGQVKRLFIYCSRAGTANLLVEGQTGPHSLAHDDVWTTFGNYAIAGDTGWNSIPFDNRMGGYSGQLAGSGYTAYRFTYWITSGTSPRIHINRIGVLPAITYQSRATTVATIGMPLSINGDGSGTIKFASQLYTARKLAVSLSNTSTDTSFNGSADVTNIKVSGQLADANIASAATWNAKQDALTINDSKPITIGTAAAANTVAGQAHTHDGITSVARASVTNIDVTNSGTEPARMTLSQVTNATTQGTDPGDGYVLNLLWDNTGNWDTQIYVPNSKKADKDFGHLKVRYKNESSTWGEWEYLPGAFKGTLLTSNDDLDTLYQGLPGEVLQYYWNYTNKAYSTVGKTQSGMDATTGLPTGTGTANLFVFHQSTSRTASGYVAQLMVCADIGIYYRRQFNGTWNTWTKILVATDITTDTTNKNGKITVDGTDKTVYVHPTSAGNKHIPSGGSSGQVLGYSSNGTAVWKDITNSMVPVGSKYDLIFNNETDRTPIKVFEVTGTCGYDSTSYTAEIIVYRRGSSGSMDNAESYRVVAAWKRREKNDAPAAIVKVLGTSLEGTWTGVVTNTVVPPIDGQPNTTFSLYYTPTVNYRMYYMHLVSCGARGTFSPCDGNITLSASVREAIPTPTYDRSTVTTATGNPVMLGETQVVTSTNSPSRDPFDSSTLLFPTERGVANMLSKYDAKFIRANNTADASNCWVKLASKTLNISNSVVSSGLWEVIIEDTYIQYSVLSFHTFIDASSTETSFSQNELIWTGNREAPASRGFNFCVTLTKKTAAGEPTIIELWCQCTPGQRGVGIREIGGNAWNPDRWDTHKWTYYNPEDSEKTTKPVGTETMTVLDTIPENFTHSVSKGINLPGNSVSYLRIAMPEYGTTHLFFGYNYYSEQLHGEYIIRQHSNGGNASQCQILNITSGTNPQTVEFRRSGRYCYVKFDRTGESGTVNYRFGTTDLSGMRACDFELVTELPSSTALITPTGPSARKLDTARKLKTKLDSTADATFDGTSNQEAIPVTGTLGVANGGTGLATVTNVNSVLIGNSSSATGAMQTIQTQSGAFYATATNGKPQFGKLPIAQGGTNATTAKAAQNSLLGGMNSATSDITTATTNFVFKYVSPDDSNGALYTRTAQYVWNWIKGLLSSESNVNISGTAAKATTTLDTSAELQVVGVQSSATSTLKRDSDVTVQGGAVKATTFKLGTNATITYNSTTEAIDFTFL